MSLHSRVGAVAGVALFAAGLASVALAVVAPASPAGAGGGMGTSVIAGERAEGAGTATAPASQVESPGTVESAATDGRLVVALRPAAKVVGRWVRLGDIADLAGLGSARMASLRDARVQRTPLPGAEKILGGEELSRRLRSLGVVEPFTISGAETVAIEAAVRTLGGDEMVRFGHEYLAGRAAGLGGEVQIEDPATPRALTVPDGEVEFRAEVPARRLAGLVPVSVEAWADGERVARVMLSYRVRARVKVVRAARALESGQVIGDDDLSVEELDLAGVPEDALTGTEALVGQRVTRPVAAGGWVRRGAVAQPLKVKRGSTVSLIAKIGNVTAKASAQSRQDGAAGEIITVVNAASKRTLRAKVLDENVVEAVMP